MKRNYETLRLNSKHAVSTSRARLVDKLRASKRARIIQLSRSKKTSRHRTRYNKKCHRLTRTLTRQNAILTRTVMKTSLGQITEN